MSLAMEDKRLCFAAQNIMLVEVERTERQEQRVI